MHFCKVLKYIASKAHFVLDMSYAVKFLNSWRNVKDHTQNTDFHLRKDGIGSRGYVFTEALCASIIF